MRDMLQEASVWAGAQRKAYAARTVSYVRSSLSVEIAATIGSTMFRQESVDGILIVVRRTDWMVDVADLVLGGEEVEPRHGDWIVDGETTFEVSAPGGEDAWRHTDATRLRWRIHTLEVQGA